MLYLAATPVNRGGQWAGYGDSRFNLPCTKNPSIPRGFDLPGPILPENDDMPSISEIAFFGVRYTPVEALRTRDAAAVKHPSVWQSESFRRQGYIISYL